MDTSAPALETDEFFQSDRSKYEIESERERGTRR